MGGKLDWVLSTKWLCLLLLVSSLGILSRLPALLLQVIKHKLQLLILCFLLFSSLGKTLGEDRKVNRYHFSDLTACNMETKWPSFSQRLFQKHSATRISDNDIFDLWQCQVLIIVVQSCTRAVRGRTLVWLSYYFWLSNPLYFLNFSEWLVISALQSCAYPSPRCFT